MTVYNKAYVITWVVLGIFFVIYYVYGFRVYVQLGMNMYRSLVSNNVNYLDTFFLIVFVLVSVTCWVIGFMNKVREKMKIGLYMYNTSPLFEIIIAKYILETKYEVVILSDEEEINTAENIKIRAKKIDERTLEEELEAIIICGGELEQSKKSADIKKLIQNMNDKGKIIASICSGNNIVVEALSMSGVENNFSGTKLINKNVFLSSADHYVQFGIVLGKLLDVYIDKNDYDETVHFFLENQV